MVCLSFSVIIIMLSYLYDRFSAQGVAEQHTTKTLHGALVAEPFHLTPEFYEGIHGTDTWGDQML